MTGDDAQPEDRTYELEELVVQPGTYFNPQTEVVVVVDDSFSIDQEVFNMEAYEGVDWVRISDEVPVDEPALEEAMEEFQTHHHVGTGGTIAGTAAELSDDEPEFEEPPDDLEPDPDPEDE
jgi:hypothetical protein